MRVRIAKESVPEGLIAVRDRRFGKDPEGQPTVLYQISIEAAAWIEALGGYYRDFAEDDKKHGDDDEEPYVLELRALGWPPLNDLATEHPRLAESFLKRSGYDFLQLICKRRAQTPRYLLNSIASLRLAKGEVAVSGVAIDLGEASTSPKP